MIQVRYSADRGHADHGWLKSFHSFSFADYYDPQHMGFRSLRVINEDFIAPGQGFPTHPHRDMEILTYIVSGQLQHKDSMGNGRIIKAGQLQTMSAGTGILHSEFNPSENDPVHLLQIWIKPASPGIKPRYAEWNPPLHSENQPLILLASPDGGGGSASIHQDARLYLLQLKKGTDHIHPLASGRAAWVQVIKGELALPGGRTLQAGDAASLTDEKSISLAASRDSLALLFDLA